MRLYIKLVVIILLTIGVHRALPGTIDYSTDTVFGIRCAIAELTGNEPLRHQLLQEAQAAMVHRWQRHLAAQAS